MADREERAVEEGGARKTGSDPNGKEGGRLKWEGGGNRTGGGLRVWGLEGVCDAGGAVAGSEGHAGPRIPPRVQPPRTDPSHSPCATLQPDTNCDEHPVCAAVCVPTMRHLVALRRLHRSRRLHRNHERERRGGESSRPVARMPVGPRDRIVIRSGEPGPRARPITRWSAALRGA